MYKYIKTEFSLQTARKIQKKAKDEYKYSKFSLSMGMSFCFSISLMSVKIKITIFVMVKIKPIFSNEKYGKNKAKKSNPIKIKIKHFFQINARDEKEG